MRLKRPTSTGIRRLAAVLAAGLALATAGQAALAMDVAILARSASGADHRRNYANSLLTLVLQRTEAEFGPYRIETATVAMERSRLFEALKDGKLVNVAANPADGAWQRGLTAIPVPIDMGLQSWRIALIDKAMQPSLHALGTLEQLKRLKVGVGLHWVTYSSLKDNRFHVVTGSNYDGLFSMLMAGRFDYFPRGVNEIFDELDTNRPGNPSLAVEDSFVLHDHIPSLFFVSPAAPHLARRIAAGMEAMLKDGSLQRFMLDAYKTALQRARLCARRVYELPNPELDAALLARRELWFDPLDPKNGICAAGAPAQAGRRHDSPAAGSH